MHEYELIEPGTLAALALLDGCAGWIAGLALLVVGLVTVRKAHATAGYLAGGAGLLQFLSACCGSWQTPASVWLEMSPPEIAYTLSEVLAFLTFLGMAGLVIGAGVVLAKAATPAGGAK